ncbi:MAG: hypothetical protein ACXVLQ_05060 [Bacteriovorax sp.]
MKYPSSLLMINLLLLASCSSQGLRYPSSNDQAKYHGLESMSLDPVAEWTEGLYAGTEKAALDQGVSVVDSVQKTFLATNNVGDFMNQLLSLKLHNKYSSEGSYRQLAEGLFAARKRIRKNLSANPKYTKEAMLLVELLAEETLYVDGLRFKPNNLIRFDYANDVSVCGNRTSAINGTKICQGDIIISKGDAGSSSFIARVSDYPGNFSHSTAPYIDANKRTFLVEAFIEDGLKLRDPAKDYVNDPKAKMMIYRNTNPSVVKEGVNGIDMIVKKIGERLGGKDPVTNASYEYDFAMDATNFDRLFCSEVSYYAYSLNPAIPAAQNPYAQAYWSNVDDPSRNIVLSRFLDAKTHFPAPSDVELNPNYEIVSMQFNPNKLSGDRMRVALIDVLIDVMNENQQQMITSINMLGKLGDQVVDPATIKSKLAVFAALGIKLPPEASTMIDSIPKNINYKQLLFFAFIDKRLAPYVVDQLSKQEQMLLKNGKVLDLESMRSSLRPLVEQELKQFASYAEKAMAK